jgi:hypothetical protein
MPVFTRSSQKKKEKDDKINPMGEPEENPLHNWSEKQKEKEELTDDELKEAKQNPQFQLALDKILERNKEKYFLLLANQGANLSSDYDTENLKENSLNVEIPSNDLSALTQHVIALQIQIKEMQGGTTMKKYALEDICPYPFNRQLTMIHFPKHCEIPKFDRYNGKTDPIDHVR